MIYRAEAAVIIPAFNESRQIERVIDAAQSADPDLIQTDNVIVVDNNSSDDTAMIATAMGARVVSCAEQGKAPAMHEGVFYARSLGVTAVTFLDGDLIGATGKHVSALTRPVLVGDAAMTIGYLGGRTRLAKEIYRRWGMFCGQRCVPVEVWDQLSERDLKAFRAEAALNSLFRNSGRGDEIKRVELKGVKHIGKFEKFKFSTALTQYALAAASSTLGLSTRSRL